MPKLAEEKIIQRLTKIDTPTIGNVVATYPRREICLKLYDAWHGQWYTDATIKCMFPELGPRVGYVATVVVSRKSGEYDGVDRWALPGHLESSKKPVALVAEQQFPPELANRVGLFGGITTTQYKALGVVGVITNGPTRDLDEIRETGVQYYATGVTPAHGETMIRAVEVPVTVGGMTVAPGDMVHMDKNGVVKFPPNKMEEILERAIKLQEQETDSMKMFENPDFSLPKWKAQMKDA